MYEIYQVPSIYAHIMNGILLFISAILIYRNYSTISRIVASEKVKLVLLSELLEVAVVIVFSRSWTTWFVTFRVGIYIQVQSVEKGDDYIKVK